MTDIKKIGIIGYGRIGNNVANCLKALKAEIFINDIMIAYFKEKSRIRGCLGIRLYVNEQRRHILTDVKMSVIIIANNNDYTSAQVALAA